MANYGFKTRNESPLQHEMGKENATKRKPSLSASGGQPGCRLTGECSVEPKSQSPDQERPGERRRESGQGPAPRSPTVSPSRDTTGQGRQCPQREPGPGLSAAGTSSLQGKDARLPREGAGPSSVRGHCAGLGPVGDAARERHCRPSATCLGHAHTGLVHFSPPLPGRPPSSSFPR